MGVDRALALVCGQPSAMAESLVLELLRRGYQVHLPATLAYIERIADQWPNRVHVSAGTTGAGTEEVAAAWQTMLSDVAATRRPIAVAVIVHGGHATGTPNEAHEDPRPAPSLFLAVVTHLQRWRGGRLLIVSNDPDSRRLVLQAQRWATEVLERTELPRGSVTSLTPRRSWLTLPPAANRVLRARSSASQDGSVVAARRGLYGTLAGQRFVSYGSRWSRPIPPSTL